MMQQRRIRTASEPQNGRQAYRCSLLLILMGLIGTEASAGTLVSLEVTGAIVAAPSCVINNNNTIEVNFGSQVATTGVDGVNYRRPVNYTLSCSGQYKNDMRLIIQGNGAGFDAGVLQTNRVGLGVALLNDGQRMPINTPLNFSYPTLPVLQAVPVKGTGVTLVAGTFEASATMLVVYQ